MDQGPKQTKRGNPVLLFWVAMLLFVSFFSGFVIALRLASPDGRTATVLPARNLNDVGYFDEKLYAEVWGLLRNTFLDKKDIDDKKLFYGALQGMVAAVGDPYTTFFDPEESKALNDELNGTFEGIGAEIGLKDKRLTVIAPLPGSPAEKAGLRPGDAILAIDDRDTGPLSLDEAVALIRGKAGSVVRLLVYRDESEAPQEISITRQKISVPSVSSTVEDGIAVINLYKFSAEAEKEFIDALREVSAQPLQGLIVDVRNNPGGFLDQAVLIASAWLEKGTVVVREVYHDERLATEYVAEPQFAAPKVPTVILINGGSASASEILAGALQDHGVATLIGSTTYGKGSVQDLRRLSDGSELKITISQWLTPRGRIINDEGIQPDTEVLMTAEDYDEDRDPQLEAAKQFIKKN